MGVEMTRNNDEELAVEIRRLAEALALTTENYSKLLIEKDNFQRELAFARSRAHRVWKDYLLFKVLAWLVASPLPFSQKTRTRLRRSAAKRDPRRSLGLPSLIEHRGSLSALQTISMLPGRLARDPDKRDVLLVSHEASRTGAPILVHNLARSLCDSYNVTVLCIRGGNLLNSFLDVSVGVGILGAIPERGTEFWTRLKGFLSATSFHFGVVNSVESRHVLPLFREIKLPSVALVHEFSAYTLPRTAFSEVVNNADEIVFSTPVTLENAVETTGIDENYRFHVLPQGKCKVPLEASAADRSTAERSSLKALLCPAGDEILVVGAGTVQLRKGVDLFIEVARRTLMQQPHGKIKFVWIGAGFAPDADPFYSVYLDDQLKRSGVAENVIIIPETSDIEHVYELAHFFVLSSRLDPLPNVAIDAMTAGVPVICFNHASGVSDILRQGGLEKQCVADYLDTNDMAYRLLRLIESKATYQEVSEKTKSLANKTFDMKTYTAEIERLGLTAAKRRMNLAHDVDTIISEPRFDPEYMLPRGFTERSISAAADLYLNELSLGMHPRRPEPGFNPHAYAADRPARFNQLQTDPYADFLRNGRPKGRWICPVIQPPLQPRATSSQPNQNLKCALHVHAYYIDELPRILRHLTANSVRPALYVSVVGIEAEEAARKILSAYNGTTCVRVVPNLGRDIGPLLTEFGRELIQNYDVVGHVHTKKSLSLANDDLVSNWTGLLLENILGGDAAGGMVDCIIDQFSAEPKLGIVFPGDPHVIGWSKNRRWGKKVADRLGIRNLPEAFDFPVGNMFWIRSDALSPFVNLDLNWNDYPREPVADDGTVLHALERLFAVNTCEMGFHSAVTYIKGVTR